MEAESQSHVSEELQKVLLSTDLSLLRSPEAPNLINGSSQDISAVDVNDDILELDEHSFRKLVPLLRSSIENNSLNTVVEDLVNSVDDNFESLESQIMQDSQVNDNLTTSIQEMASIKNIIDGSLKDELMTLQDQLASSTNDVILKKQFFINNKKTTTKISESIILINKILQILELSNKCQELIKDGDFFKALQSLGSLEKIYLQDFRNYDFEFLKEIYSSIPLLKSKIKDESINLIKSSFNSKLEDTLLMVGNKYFDFYNEILLQEWMNSRNAMKLGNFKFNSPLEISLRDPKKLEELRLDHFYHLDEFYDSILIFQELKELNYLCEEFSKEYEFRKAKLVSPLELKSNVSSSLTKKTKSLDDLFGSGFNTEHLKKYMLRILGFLIYDKHLNRSTDYILSQNSYTTTDDFWTVLMNKLSPYLEDYISEHLNNEEELIGFKNFLGIYIAIVENLKLNIEVIYKAHVSIFQKYSALLVRLFDREFSTLLSDDDFMPLTINDKSLYEKVLKICWLKDDELQNDATMEEHAENEFYATLPFSPLYPMTCTLSKKTYNKLVAFLNNFYRHDLNHLNYLLVRTMEDIFSNIVNKKMKEKLDTTSREEIAQVLINFDYFVIAAREFSNILTKENITENPEVDIRLTSIQDLTDSRKYAETKLIELIDSKVSDLMEFVEFDWTSTELEQEPDISVRDIAQFLEMMFTSTLVNLPYSVKTLLIFREFDALTRKFLEVLLNSTPSVISRQSVLNFELNMEFLESVISKIFPNESETTISNLDSPIPQSPEPENQRSSNLIENNIRSLQSTFTDLKQHIEFLKSQNMEEYKDSSVRMRKYPRIKPENAQLLYRKVAPRTDASSSEQERITPDNSFTDSMTSNRRIAKFFNRT